jgi:hypothetical protein
MAQRVQQEAQQAVQQEIQPGVLCLCLIHPHHHSLLETTRVEMMKGHLQRLDLKEAQLRLEYEKHETWYVSLLSTTAPPRQSMDSQGIGGSYERVPKDDRGQKQPSLAPGGMAPTTDRLVPLDLVRPIHRVRSMSDLQEALAQEARPAGGVAAQAGVFQATAVPRESPSWT